MHRTEVIWETLICLTSYFVEETRSQQKEKNDDLKYCLSYENKKAVGELKTIISCPTNPWGHEVSYDQYEISGHY